MGEIGRYLQKKKKYSLGFTLAELLITMAILIIIASTGFVYLGSYRRTAEIDSALQKMVSFTREAQARAKAGQDGVAWGIRWDNPLAGEDFYVLFKDTYASTNTTQIIYLGNSIEFSNPSTSNNYEVIFQRITGNPDVTSTSITITSRIDSSITKTITINSLGQIDY